MIAFVKKHKERAALVGMGIGFLLFVGGGIYLQKQNRRASEEIKEQEVKKVELTVRKSTSSPQQETEGASTQAVTSAFFLEPSPGELLEKLESLDNLREDVAKKTVLNLRIIWPVYFFSLDEQEGAATAVFDVSEDGFGITVQTMVDTARYPEIKELQPGEKLWLGGEIIGVDLSGVGTIYLKMEQLDLSPEGPLARLKGPEAGS